MPKPSFLAVSSLADPRGWLTNKTNVKLEKGKLSGLMSCCGNSDEWNKRSVRAAGAVQMMERSLLQSTHDFLKISLKGYLNPIEMSGYSEIQMHCAFLLSVTWAGHGETFPLFCSLCPKHHVQTLVPQKLKAAGKWVAVLSVFHQASDAVAWMTVEPIAKQTRRPGPLALICPNTSTLVPNGCI